MSGQNPTREYSRERKWYMDRASVKKVEARGTLLAVSEMDTNQLWRAAHERAVILRQLMADGRDPRAMSLALDLEALVDWLWSVGTQQQLFRPE